MDCSTPGFAVLHCLPEFAKLTSTESVMPSNPVVLFSSCPPSSPSSGSFPVSQFFTSGDQSIGASASASVLPRNTKLVWTCLKGHINHYGNIRYLKRWGAECVLGTPALPFHLVFWLQALLNSHTCVLLP